MGLQDCFTNISIVIMNRQFQVHRNKCHMCFKNTGRFILDCYCILCEECFAKRNREMEQCIICHQKSKHNFIDVQDRSNVCKMSYLFSNLQFSFNRCIEAYKFQAGIDAKYCKYLQNQLAKYKQAISEIVMFNPEFASYFDAKLASKPRPRRSASESLPNQQNHTHHREPNKKHSNPPNTPRSLSTSSVVMQHQRLVDPQRLGGNGQRNYSGKVNYKMPNINYNTALRSSKRHHQIGDDDDHTYYHRPNR